MKNNLKFGLAEAVVLMTMSAMARIFLGYPRYIIEVAGTAAWLSVAAGFVYALLQVYLFYLILKPHPQKNILEITEGSLGRFAGPAMNIIFSLYFIAVAAIFVRPFSETLIISTLPGAPISVITIGFLGASGLGAYVGLEAMARAARVTYPFVLGGIVILLMGLSPQWNLSDIYPILGNGPFNVFFIGAASTSFLSEILLAAIIVKSFYGPNMFNQVMVRSLAMAFLYFVLLEIIVVITVTWSVASEYTLPFYNVSRLIYLSRFFQRIESIFVIIWGFIGIIKVALTLYAAAYTLSTTLKLPDYRPLVIPMVMITFTLSLLPPDFPTTILIDSQIMRKYVVPFATIALPTVVLLVDRVRNRRVGNEGG